MRHHTQQGLSNEHFEIPVSTKERIQICIPIYSSPLVTAPDAVVYVDVELCDMIASYGEFRRDLVSNFTSQCSKTSRSRKAIKLTSINYNTLQRSNGCYVHDCTIRLSLADVEALCGITEYVFRNKCMTPNRKLQLGAFFILLGEKGIITYDGKCCEFNSVYHKTMPPFRPVGISAIHPLEYKKATAKSRTPSETFNDNVVAYAVINGLDNEYCSGGNSAIGRDTIPNPIEDQDY